jgi:1-acylglycerone phosphate reductase
MTSLTKESVLITGCSKDGIGDALAQEFLSRGFRVFATARNLAKIQHLKESGCEVIALDVTDEESVSKAVGYVGEKTGDALHYLVNNAGMSKPLPPTLLAFPHLVQNYEIQSVSWSVLAAYRATILDTDMQSFKQVFDAKVFGAVSMTKSFGPLLIKTKGTVCNIGSMSTYFFSPINGAYSGANSALEYLSHQMRMELEPFGVSVVHVSSKSRLMVRFPVFSFLLLPSQL